MRVRSAGTRVDARARVVQRGTLLERVSEREKVKQGGRWERHPEFDEGIAVASLQHLYFRHLLNVGDSGTHNILVREDRATSGRSIAGIDFDEQRRRPERRTALGHFFKDDHGYLEDIYGPFLGPIVCLEAIAPAVANALDDLNVLYTGWLTFLPPTRRPQPSEGVLRADDILARNERLRSLMRPLPGSEGS
jgi:hypothetical protein